MEVLKDLREGALVDELDEALKEVVAAVRETGRTGKLTLTLQLKTASEGDSSVLLVRDTVKLTLPERLKSDTFLFATKDNGLSRRDPRQLTIDDVEKPDKKPDNVTQFPNQSKE